MASNRPRDLTERELTDRSLADERGKTDVELEKRRTAVDQQADEVVSRARERADHVLHAARSTADETLLAPGGLANQQEAVAEERRREDAAVHDERTTADRTLSEERGAYRQALAALLALEREETDQHLRLERDRADAAVGSRDEFLAMVSHDVRNMLGGIAMSAASLRSVRCDPASSAVVTREAQRIQRYTARMNRLVGDLLDLASIEAGRLAVMPKQEDAIELIRETVDAFQPIATVKHLSLRTEVKAGALLAQYDHERILQVLANLVGNAVKFGSPGGRIDIVVEAIAGEIRFAVSDTGPGIPSDKLEVVFDRFWQNSADKRTSSGGGLGLGLYIARCIVEAHGGRIWAQSSAGAGSTFYFTLPAAETRES